MRISEKISELVSIFYMQGAIYIYIYIYIYI